MQGAAGEGAVGICFQWKVDARKAEGDYMQKKSVLECFEIMPNAFLIKIEADFQQYQATKVHWENWVVILEPMVGGTIITNSIC